MRLVGRPSIYLRGGKVCKQAYLVGGSRCISKLIDRRNDDVQCHQQPRRRQSQPYAVRVRYVMTDSVQIQTIHLEVTSSRKVCWSLIYSKDRPQYGHACSSDGPTQYYLTAEEALLIAKPIQSYERRIALRRLSRDGPDAIPRTRPH